MHQDDGDDLEVPPDNWFVLFLFLAVSSQWRTSGMGGIIGLDYTAVYTVKQAGDFYLPPDTPDDPDWFNKLRMIEAAAVRASAEKNQA